MDFGLRDIPRLLMSQKRMYFLKLVWIFKGWILFYPFAWLYRRTVATKAKLAVVVGSYGKTTTTITIKSCLGLDPLQGSNGNCCMHLVKHLFALRPSPLLSVTEVGISKPGQMARYSSMLRPDVAVVTAVGSDHHQTLGGLSGVLKEKTTMVASLPSDGLAILNGDDPKVRAMACQTKAEVIF